MSERERYRRAKEIFEAALEVEEREREAYLTQACGSDQLLQQEVKRLLDSDRKIDSNWDLAVEARVVEQFAAACQHDETQSLIGQTLNDRYFVEVKLGQGGFGATYLALDQRLHTRPVVVKLFLPGQGRSEWAEKKFRHEIRALVRINHPGVVGLFDSGITPDGKPFFVMEYIEGVSLRSAMSAEGMGLERAANIIQQLGRALSAAHDKGVYHRDLKPENIILQTTGKEEQVKVIDFGIATVKDSIDEETKMTKVAGTIPYMAPEQFEGRPSASSDIYALGIVAYEMLTGRLPFDKVSSSDLYTAIKEHSKLQQTGIRIKPKEFRPDLPGAAQEEILRALSYNPKARHAQAWDFGDRLAHALIDSEQRRLETIIVTEPLPAPAMFESELTRKLDTEARRKKAVSPARPKPAMTLWLLIAVASLLVVGIVGPITFHYIKSRLGGERIGGKTVEDLREHTLSYWGELREYRGNKQVGEVIRLTGGIAGETYFKTGDGLRFFVSSSDDGHVYLINEETGPGNVGTTYRVLFPSPAANGGSSKVKRDEQIATSECLFDEIVGTEKVWIIWTADRVEELERVVQQWNGQKDLGEIKDAGQAAFLSDFIGKYVDNKLLVEQDQANELMRLRGRGDVMVYSLKLKHR
jgi:predicted Ser/Thr protein kinase